MKSYMTGLNCFIKCFGIILMIHSIGLAAPPETPLPSNLAQWKEWVLFGKEDKLCPTHYNNAQVIQCMWPTKLQLELTASSGQFIQEWYCFKEDWVQIPGGKGSWPDQVTIDNKTSIVVDAKGLPSIYLTKGIHQVKGQFNWTRMPETLPVTKSVGLISLTIDHKKIDFPQIDNESTLWLRKTSRIKQDEDRLYLTIYRLLCDTIPMQMIHYIKLSISGNEREERLVRILPKNLIPLQMNSALPMHFSNNGDIILRARPGQWDIQITTRFETMPEIIEPESVIEGREIWSFQSNNELRMIRLEGVPPVDPNKTDMPNHWKNYPAYLITPGAKIKLSVERRGDPDPAPDQLSLQRSYWLDFDGKGYTCHDVMSGTIHKSWRLSINPPIQLGRVDVNGMDQLITSYGQDNKPGIEVRQGSLSLSADSRLNESTHTIPAVSWDHDFQSVSASIYIPPGWRVLSGFGADKIHGTMIEKWTLLDCFIVILISMAVWKIFHPVWGFIALFAIMLSYHEPYAPRIVWLHALLSIALFKVLPPGSFKKIINLYRISALIALIVIAVPYMAHQIRIGIYPQLDKPSHIYPQEFGKGYDMTQQVQRSMESDHHPKMRLKKALPMMAQESVPENIALFKQDDAMTIDEQQSDLIQTGPGLPKWQWRQVTMNWNGPVDKMQTISLWLLSPGHNLMFSMVRVLLIAILILSLCSSFIQVQNDTLKRLLPSLLICVITSTAMADVIPDGTTDTSITPSGLEYIISSNNIPVGATNLFHSFKVFDIDTHEMATFTGPSSIQNIISRVTGGEASWIDGKLHSSIAGANLYLLNPWGFIFGANAALDIGGSFFAATADSLFSSDMENFFKPGQSLSLYSKSQPIGFGMSDQCTGSIILDGATLSVQKGQSITLLGMDHEKSSTIASISNEIPGIQFKGACLNAPGGNIHLISLAGSGAVYLDQPTNNFSLPGNITMMNKSDIRTGGEGVSNAGDVIIYGGFFYSDNSTIFAGADENGGNVYMDTEAVSFSNRGTADSIDTKSYGNGTGGTVSIKAKSWIHFSDSSIITKAGQGQSDQSGDVLLDAKDITFDDGSYIAADTFGDGSGGNISLNASSEIIFSSGSSIHSKSRPNSTGQSGTISLNAPTIIINNGCDISVSSDGEGQAGSIEMNGANIILSNQSTISSESMIAGDAGKIDIKATQSLTLKDPHTSINTSTYGNGDAGDIELKSNNINIINGASVSSDSFSEGGDAGSIKMYQANKIQIKNSTLSTGAANAGGGMINLDANQLIDIENSNISTSVKEGAGQGGNITLGHGLLVLNQSIIESNAHIGDGGIIRLISDHFIPSSTSLLSASSKLGISGQIDIIVTQPDTGIDLSISTYDFFDAHHVLKDPRGADFNESRPFALQGRDGPPPLINTWLAGSPTDFSQQKPDQKKQFIGEKEIEYINPFYNDTNNINDDDNN